MKPLTPAQFDQLRRGLMGAWDTRRQCNSAACSEEDMEIVRLIRAAMQQTLPRWKPRRAARIQPRQR